MKSKEGGKDGTAYNDEPFIQVSFSPKSPRSKSSSRRQSLRKQVRLMDD